MAGKSGRPKLILSPEQKEELTRLSHARGSPAREVQRAQILCRFEAGESITQIDILPEPEEGFEEGV